MSEPLKENILDILHTYLADNVQARDLRPDGAYVRRDAGGSSINGICANPIILKKKLLDQPLQDQILIDPAAKQKLLLQQCMTY